MSKEELIQKLQEIANLTDNAIKAAENTSITTNVIAISFVLDCSKVLKELRIYQ